MSEIDFAPATLLQAADEQIDLAQYISFIGPVAFVSFRRERGLIVFFPFLKFLIAHSATLDWRDRSFVENCFACGRI
jgi:hypothetical protein